MNSSRSFTKHPDFKASRLPIIKARFVERPNRFLVLCDLGGKTVEAYLPNPGRLWELLLPGRTLHLAENPPDPDKSTRYTTLAVEREGRPILLHTHLTNDVAARLLAGGRLPGFEGAAVIRREAAAGSSRYDFLLERGGREFFLEIKSCTLFAGRIAMFPDAVTARGRKHLEQLALHAKQGTPGGVVFLVHSPQADTFMPDYHTDLDFSQTLLSVKKDILVKAFTVSWGADLSLGSRVREAHIPWGLIEREARDEGAYLLVLEMARSRRIDVGGLGRIVFPKGYYVYAGSARANLSARVERHLRRRKNFHWHIDYLRDAAHSCTALPIRASEDLEHGLAQALGKLAGWTVPRFGSSDCGCATHLFGFDGNPVRDPKFIELLLHFRIKRLEAFIKKGRKSG
jgi:sugar fermentation stimulation protein A